MKPRLLVLLTVLVAALASKGVTAAQRGTGEIKFLKMTVPGSVERVTWSVQGGRCSVQIWGPTYRIGQGDPTDEIQARETLLPPTQVWLLQSDGTAIPHAGRTEKSTIVHDGAANSVIASYFPRSARTKAISVVVRVGDQFLVEPLPYID
jgi:hypothetical protein